MSASLQEIEQRLAESYRRQKTIYEQALRVADGLSASWHTVVDVVGALNPLNAVLELLHQHSQVMEPQRQAWAALNCKPGVALANALHECASAIERLRVRIGDLERMALERKQRLTPELDNFARGWQMQKAYSGFGKGALP